MGFLWDFCKKVKFGGIFVNKYWSFFAHVLVYSTSRTGMPNLLIIGTVLERIRWIACLWWELWLVWYNCDRLLGFKEKVFLDISESRESLDRWKMTRQFIPDVEYLYIYISCAKDVECRWEKWFWSYHWGISQRNCHESRGYKRSVKACILVEFQRGTKAAGSATLWKQ